MGCRERRGRLEQCQSREGDAGDVNLYMGGRGVARRDPRLIQTHSGPCPDCVTPQNSHYFENKFQLPDCSLQSLCALALAHLCSLLAPHAPLLTLLGPQWPHFYSSSLPNCSSNQALLRAFAQVVPSSWNALLLVAVSAQGSSLGRYPQPLTEVRPCSQTLTPVGHFSMCISIYDCPLDNLMSVSFLHLLECKLYEIRDHACLIPGCLFST